jgi:hypothetical protein
MNRVPSKANHLDRLPFDENASEATYEVRLTTDVDALPAVREDLLDHALGRSASWFSLRRS